MKILRTLGFLALIVGLVLGSSGSVLAKGPPAGSQGVGPNSSGRHGLFGTVESTDGYDVTLVTKDGSTVEVTLTDTAKYKVPRESKGSVDRDSFEMILDGNVDGDITAMVGSRIAVLATFTDESTADALRLMLIPMTPPLHAHRVGIVADFTPYTPEEDGSDGSIEIIDKDGVSHIFTITEDTVYRPSAEDDGISELEGEDLIAALIDGCVTVVTKGDPKLGPSAKAIVLHEELPDWAGGKIVVYKIVDPDTSEQSFEFIAEYYTESFYLSHGDHDNSGWLEPGEYDITENMDELPEGEDWALTIEIVDPDGESRQDGTTATVDLDRGEVVTVTFTNTFTEPVLP